MDAFNNNDIVFYSTLDKMRQKVIVVKRLKNLYCLIPLERVSL